MSNSREVSQFSNFIVVDDSNRNIGIATTATPYVGIGLTNPTAKLDVNGDLKVSGSSTFGGNVNLGDGDSLYFGDGNDLRIFSGGNNSFIQETSASGSLYIDSTNLVLRNGAGNENLAKFLTDGAVELYYDNDKKFETTGYGVSVTGGLNVTGISTLGTVEISSGIITATTGIVTYYGDGQYLENISAGTATTATNADNINISATPSDSTTYPVFVANNATGNQTPFIDSGISWNATSNILSVPTIQISTGIDLNDSDYIYFGTSDDVKVFYDGSNNDLEIELESSANKIAITNNGTYKHLITKDGKVGINTSITPTVELEVNGNTNITGVVTATAFYGDGQYLQNVSGGAADGTDFNTGITTTVYFNPGIARTDYPFTGIGISFPSTAGKKYIVESIHVTNVVANDMYITSEVDYNGGEIVPLTNRVIVPYQGAVDLLEESIIANPEDKLRFLAYTGIGTTAPTRANAIDCFITYTEKDNTDYIGTGATITQTIGSVGYAQTVFTSTTYPSVINTIVLTNYSNFVDVDASVFMRRGGTIQQGYFVYNLTIPQNSSVQILPKAKRLNATDTIVVNASQPNVLSVNLAGVYIT